MTRYGARIDFYIFNFDFSNFFAKTQATLARVSTEFSPNMFRNELETFLMKTRSTQYPETMVLAAPTATSEADSRVVLR